MSASDAHCTTETALANASSQGRKKQPSENNDANLFINFSCARKKFHIRNVLI